MSDYELKLLQRVTQLERQVTGILRDTVRGDWQSGLRRMSYDAQSRHLCGTLSIPEDFPLGVQVARYPQERNLWNHKVWAFFGALQAEWEPLVPAAVGSKKKQHLSEATGGRNLQVVAYRKDADAVFLLERKEILLESLVKLWNGRSVRSEQQPKSTPRGKDVPEGPSAASNSGSSTCASEPKKVVSKRRRTSRKSIT